MIPPWLKILGSLAPMLIFLSIGVIVFGVYKLLGSMAGRSLEKEEEEAKRQEFLKKMNIKMQDGKLKQ